MYQCSGVSPNLYDVMSAVLLPRSAQVAFLPPTTITCAIIFETHCSTEDGTRGSLTAWYSLRYSFHLSTQHINGPKPPSVLRIASKLSTGGLGEPRKMISLGKLTCRGEWVAPSIATAKTPVLPFLPTPMTWQALVS